MLRHYYKSWGGSGICLDGLMTYSDANMKKRLFKSPLYQIHASAKTPAVVIMVCIML